MKTAVRAARLAVAAGPWHAAGFAVAAVVIGMLPVVAALLTRYLVDGLAGNDDTARLLLLAAALAGTGIALGAVPHCQRYLVGELGRRTTLAAKDRLYAAVNGFQGLGRFEDPGYLNRIELARQAGDTAPVTLLRSGLGVGQSAVTASGFLATLLVLEPILAALVVATAIPALLAQLALSRRRAELMALTTPMYRRHFFFAGLLTRAQAAKEVRLFGIGDFLRGRMLDEQRRSNGAEARLERHDVGVQVRLSVLTALVGGAALVWAVLAARRGEITIGDVMILAAAVSGVQSSLATIVDSLADGQEALLLHASYLAVLDDRSDLPVPATTRPLPPLRHGLEFDDVWFRYADEGPWVLRGLTLTIPAERTCGLVGINGSGKSTLVKLLCRFYDPQRGAIRWDGIDLREIDPVELRSRLGVLFQDFMQYDLTARENVALGDLRSAGESGRVEAAAGLAGIHDTLRALPAGYETSLTRAFADEDGLSTGVLLSGGQWQRVALARALLRGERDLLVLDEPSSGLDAAAEHEMHARLRDHRRGRTSLVVSHRLGALRDADIIVVLGGGTVIERGTHESLMAAGGEYSRLFRLQARGYGAMEWEGDADGGDTDAGGVHHGGDGGVVPALAASGGHGAGAQHGTGAV